MGCVASGAPSSGKLHDPPQSTGTEHFHRAAGEASAIGSLEIEPVIRHTETFAHRGGVWLEAEHSRVDDAYGCAAWRQGFVVFDGNEGVRHGSGERAVTKE
jgi:hypothetical protein